MRPPRLHSRHHRCHWRQHLQLQAMRKCEDLDTVALNMMYSLLHISPDLSKRIRLRCSASSAASSLSTPMPAGMANM